MAIFSSTQMRGAHTITARNVSDALWLAKQKLEGYGVEVEQEMVKQLSLENL